MPKCTFQNEKTAAILKKQNSQEMQGKTDQSTPVTDHFNLHVSDNWTKNKNQY